MANIHPSQARAIGEKLRSIRKEKKMSLRKLAAQAEISASMLSQIETGKVFPSVRSLYGIASTLGVSVDYFFPEQNNSQGNKNSDVVSIEDLTASEMRSARLNDEAIATVEFERGISSSPVIQASTRPSIELNGGVSWSRLTSLAEKDAEFLEITYSPGAMSGMNRSHHGGREFGLILEGELIVELGFESYTLKTGDSIIFESTTPHRLINKSGQPMRAVWVVMNQH